MKVKHMQNFIKEILTLKELILIKDQSSLEGYRSELIKKYGYTRYKKLLKQASLRACYSNYTLNHLEIGK